jgi:hypothetical protein
MTAAKGTPSGVLHPENANAREREPSMRWQELVQLAMGGFFPGDQRLEQLLDRLERLP